MLGQPVSLNVVAQDPAANCGVATAFSNPVTLSTTDPALTYVPTSSTGPIAMTAGKGSTTVIFNTIGSISITATAGGASTNTFSITATNSVGGCASCFASLGAGAVVSNLYPDYNNVNNVLAATHLGSGTPQYLIGVAYKLPWRAFPIPYVKFSKRFLGAYSVYSHLGCGPTDLTNDRGDAKAAYCYPYKAFINLKLAPDASQTINGFTYGLSHALHKDLDLLLGFSFSTYNEVSPGFRNAATQVVKSQPSNPCYTRFNVDALNDQKNATAFDGFPTTLQTNSGTPDAPVCTSGAQIYAGNVLVTHHHGGFFIGIAVPIQFKSSLGLK